MNDPRKTRRSGRILLSGAILLILLAACTTTDTAGIESDGEQEANLPEGPATSVAANTRLPASKYDEYRIVTLLPRDAIPAIDNPEFLNAVEADRFYDPDELIIGVEFGGEARAYSVPFLSRHEIVNDDVGGVKIAVTW